MEYFSLANEHGDDLIPGTAEYINYARGAIGGSDFVMEAIRLALEGNKDTGPSVEHGGYFGVTLLKLGKYGADLVSNRMLNESTDMYFDSADPSYDSEHRALTIEGTATRQSTPQYALDTILTAAKIARELEELSVSFQSLDKEVKQ
jgi:hypothetical protein